MSRRRNFVLFSYIVTEICCCAYLSIEIVSDKIVDNSGII